MQELTGRKLSKYTITSLIGVGGMSHVYRAHDKSGKCDVAIKVLKEGISSSRVEDLIRFRREATTVSKLNHDNLVKVHEVGEAEIDGKILNYIVMDLVEGQTLDEWMCSSSVIPDLIRDPSESKSLDSGSGAGTTNRIENSIEIISQIARALDYVHNAGVIHRDLKPGNIIVTSNEGRRTRDEKNRPSEAVVLHPSSFVKLLDFGLSQVMELEKISDRNEIVGTFSYMSPEQSGIIRKTVDERSDLYSLGIIFYQLATGQLPFEGDSVAHILHQQVAKAPPPPKQINKDVPEIIAQMILKLLRKDPEERYQTAKGLLSDLGRYQNGESSFVLGKNDRMARLTYRTRLIGRQQEYNRLKELYDKASQGNGSVCLVGGEAGRGKSRLVEELRSYVIEQDGEFIGGKCFDQSNKIPYQPFSESINEYISKINKLGSVTSDIPRENAADTSGVAANKVSGLPRGGIGLSEKDRRINRMKESFGELGEVICRLNSNMREVLGEVPPLVALDPERENRRFLMVAAKFFQALGKKNEACVIMLDDLQWSDEGTLTLLQEIVETISKSPILILGTYRDNEVDAEHSLTKLIENSNEKQYPLEQIMLTNFDESRISRMITELLVDEDEAKYADISRFVYDKGKGNPFFTLEIVRQLVSQDVVMYKEGNWQIDREKLDKVEVSKTIVDIVLKRIEQLTPDQLELYSTASVIGRKFKIELLYNIIPRPREKIINLVDEGISLQLLERGSEHGEMIFVHDRVRDAFYHKVDKEREKGLHLNIAKTLEEMYSGSIDEVLFDLAHHYAESGDKDKTLQYSIPAADKAKLRFANEEAIRYYNTAIRLFDELGKGKEAEYIRAKVSLIDVYLTIGMSDAAIEVSREVLKYKNNNVEKAEILNKIGLAWFKKGAISQLGELIEGLRLLNERHPKNNFELIVLLLRELMVHVLQNVFPKTFCYKEGTPVREEDRVIIKLYRTFYWMYVYTDLNRFIFTMLRMLNIAQSRIGKSNELAEALNGYATTLGVIPIKKRSYKYFLKSINMHKELNNELGLGQAQQMLSWFRCVTMTDFNISEKIAIEACDRFRKLGDSWELAMTTNILAHIYLYRGEFERSIEYYNSYLSISNKIGNDHGIVEANAYTAYCCILQGRFNEAEMMLKKAYELATENIDQLVVCYTLNLLGELEMARKRYDKAEEYLLKAKDIDSKKQLLKPFTVVLYSNLTDCYLERYLLYGNNHNIVKARKMCKKALSESKNWIIHYGAALRVTGKYNAIVHNYRKAQDLLLKSICHNEKIGRRVEVARACFDLGQCYKSVQNLRSAQDQMNKAYSIFKETGTKLYSAKCATILGIKEEQDTISEGETTRERLTDKRELSSVITVSHHLSSILDLDVLLEKIMDAAIEVSGAESGYLFLYAKDDAVAQATASGVANLKIAVSRNVEKDAFTTEEFAVSRTVISEVEKSRQAKLIIDAGQDDSLKTQESVVKHGLRSIMCVPLIVREKLLGMVYVENRQVGGLFNQDKLEVLKTMSIQAAISIENARLYKEVQEKARMEEELKLGHEIQQNLLPKDIPEVPGIKVYGLMEPAKEIGGDYYDFIVGERCQVKGEREERERAPEFIRVDKDQKTSLSPSTSHLVHKLNIIIGDVSGKGVGAGMIMTSTKGILENMSYEDIGLKDKVLRLNRSLIRITHQEKMMTMLMLEWDAEARRLKYCGAGHEPMIVCRTNPNDQIPMTNENSEKKSGIQTIKAGGIMLGMIPDIDSMIEENELKVASGDKILLYTDGITEARDEKGEFYTLERLQASASRHSEKPLEEMITAIKQDVRKYISTAEQYDDITLVGIEVL